MDVSGESVGEQDGRVATFRKDRDRRDGKGEVQPWSGRYDTKKRNGEADCESVTFHFKIDK